LTIRARTWQIAMPLLVIAAMFGAHWVHLSRPSRKGDACLDVLGHDRQDALTSLGEPDAVITSEAELLRSPFNAYRHSVRGLEGPVLVYLRGAEMICVYVDEDDRVVSVYFGQKLDAPARITGRRGEIEWRRSGTLPAPHVTP